MEIDVSLILTADCLEKKEIFIHPTVVVYDILRASSTMITALSRGAKAIIPVARPEEAWHLSASLGNNYSGILLGGERQGKIIPGFHLGNSPLEYTEKMVREQLIIYTTTNGTRALINSAKTGAQKILIGGLINQTAVVHALLQETAFTIVCAGFKGQFALEDFYGAGLMLRELRQAAKIKFVDDGSLAAWGLANGFQGHPAALALGQRGRGLQRARKEEDLRFCADTNRFAVVPVYADQRVVIPSPPEIN